MFRDSGESPLQLRNFETSKLRLSFMLTSPLSPTPPSPHPPLAAPFPLSKSPRAHAPNPRSALLAPTPLKHSPRCTPPPAPDETNAAITSPPTKSLLTDSRSLCPRYPVLTHAPARTIPPALHCFPIPPAHAPTLRA